MRQMGKKASVYTVFIGMSVAIVVGWLALKALNAGESAYLLVVFVPFFSACYLLSGVLHNDGFKRRKR
jgi:hypothetical protein